MTATTTCRRAVLPALTLALAAAALAASDTDLKAVGGESPLAGRLGAMGLILAGEGERLRSIGSGFLVSSCHALTAAHVLAREGGSPRPGMPVRFVPALGNYAVGIGERALWGRVVAVGEDFVARGAASDRLDARNTAADWALVELERPVAGVEPFRLLHPGATETAPLAAVGFPLNQRTMMLQAHERCGIRRGYHDAHRLMGLLVTDCAVREGMSGGPLLMDAGGPPIAVGIIVQRVEIGVAGERIAAMAVPVSAFADRIAPVMRDSRVCAVGQPFALPPAPPPAPPEAADLQSSNHGGTKAATGTTAPAEESPP